MSSKSDHISLGKALSIMEKLLQGKNVKEVAYEEDVSKTTVYGAKYKLPLFFWNNQEE
jgi:transposase